MRVSGLVDWKHWAVSALGLPVLFVVWWQLIRGWTWLARALEE